MCTCSSSENTNLLSNVDPTMLYSSKNRLTDVPAPLPVPFLANAGPVELANRLAPKLAHFFVRHITSSYIDQFSNFFHYQNWEKISNNTITNDLTAPQVCRLWNVSVLKATIENKTTSVTTHFKSASSSSKADTLNIWCKKNCKMWQLL